MDPCPFVRLIIESLSLKLPPAANHASGAGIHPAAVAPCSCKITLNHDFPSQTVLLPLADTPLFPAATHPTATFHLDPPALRRLSGRPATLRISIYSGRSGRTCGVMSGKLLGRVRLSVSLEGTGSARPGVLHSGWMKLGERPKLDDEACARLHLVVRSEPEPRFVFQFGGEPECSPVVFQIQGNIQQPVFSCKFNADRNSRSRTLPADFSSHRPWPIGSFPGDRERKWRERKGWMIMIYDLSGSLVAAASMITPFVPSPRSDQVSRSNPGAWLILRAHGDSLSSWKPWGRLEAWRETGQVDGLGCSSSLSPRMARPVGSPFRKAR